MYTLISSVVVSISLVGSVVGGGLQQTILDAVLEECQSNDTSCCISGDRLSTFS